MSAPGGILTLDLSLTTGWAYGLASMGRPVCGVWKLPGGGDNGRTYTALGNILADAIHLHQPALVVMEAPLIKQQTSARLLLGLAAHVESTCYRWEVPCREQSVMTVRKLVLGRGMFPKGMAKAAVLAWCAEKAWPVQDDNAADACVLWAYARQTMATRLMGRAA